MIAHLKALGTMPLGNMAVQTGVDEAEAAQQSLVRAEARDAAAKTKTPGLVMVSADAAGSATDKSEGQAIEIDRATVRHSRVLHACMQLWEL
jgi:hypothetical protein